MSIMSDDENLVPSPTSFKVSNTTINKMYTPCRRVGLKRRSVNSQSCTNILKKTKVNNETVKHIEFDENATVTNYEEKVLPKLNYNDKNIIKKNIIDKQHEIEKLRSEFRNCEQHNLDQIQKLSSKWLTVCQEALMSLLNQLNGNQNSNLHTMEDLIKNLDIDPDLIHFDINNQEFY